MAAIYVGQDQHAIDVKGRINIPARHRRVAAQRGCVEFWFSPGFGPYVMLWDAKGFEAYSERLLQLPAGDRKVMHLRRSIYSNACEVEPDGQGRVVIPEWLRQQEALLALPSAYVKLDVQQRPGKLIPKIGAACRLELIIGAVTIGDDARIGVNAVAQTAVPPGAKVSSD